jgi:hypothetical protein
MMFDLKSKFELSDPVLVGEREFFIASERLSISDKTGRNVHAALVSPLYLIVAEKTSNYAFSLTGGQALDLGNLFSNNPALEQEFLRARNLSAKRDTVVKEKPEAETNTPSDVDEFGYEIESDWYGF